MDEPIYFKRRYFLNDINIKKRVKLGKFTQKLQRNIQFKSFNKKLWIYHSNKMAKREIQCIKTSH